MKNIKNIALTGGGTGGHIFPLMAIYNYFREDKSDDGENLKYKFIWVGEEDSIEEEITKKYKIKFLSIPAGKIRRYFDIRNLYEPFKNLTGIVFGIYYILRYNINIVFSKGGYVSLPLCIAAIILRKKIYIHESDMVVGLSNKIISKIATKIFYTFPNDKIDNKKHILSGQILNPEIIDYLTSLEIEENKRLTVMVIGGSQGSTVIFEALLKILPKLNNINFHIVLGTKNRHFRKKLSSFSNVMVHDFLTQKILGKILKNIDIAITRGSATTLGELNMFGIHSIIVPNKNSAGNHQQKNALYFQGKFQSDILDEKKSLGEEIFKKLQTYKDLRKSGLNLDKFFDPLNIIKKEIER